jgi:hypothetical protein
MPQKLPLACTAFGTFGIGQFAVFSQNVHDGLLSSIATFPTPPILPAALQGLINDYVTAADNAVLLGKDNVSLRNASRKKLQNALRADASYVNQILQDMVLNGTDYADIQTLILATGYVLSIDPSPVGPLSAPTIKRYYSTTKGQLNIHVDKVIGAKSYTTEVSLDGNVTFTTYLSSTTRIKVVGLPSASTALARVLANGSNTSAVNYSAQISQVII